MSEILIGKVLASKYDEDDFLCVQIETLSGSGNSGQWFFLSNPHGMQARPLDPDDRGACQAFYWYVGSIGYAMLANDPRTQGLLPASQKGEVFLHGPTGAFVRFKLDGSVSTFTTDDNTTNGRSVYQTISPTGLEFSFPYGRFTFDDTGFHLQHASGARLDGGSLAAPAPLNSLGSYLTASAAMVHIEGSAIHNGPEAGVPMPVALAPVTLALMNALSAVLVALETPGAFISASPGSPAAPGPGLLAAIGTATGAIAGAATTLGSVSTTATGGV